MYDTVAQVGTKFSHRVMTRLAEYFANKTGYDQDIVQKAHDQVMTEKLEEFPSRVVNEIFADPPEELAEFTNNAGSEPTEVLEHKNRSVITNEVPANE